MFPLFLIAIPESLLTLFSLNFLFMIPINLDFNKYSIIHLVFPIVWWYIGYFIIYFIIEPVNIVNVKLVDSKISMLNQ